MNENDKYIINEDYHGDVKVIKNNSKKVDLSKPTDILEHRVKQNIKPLKSSSSNEKICLTKQKDIPINQENKDFVSRTTYNSKMPIHYTIDKSEPPEGAFKEMFSKLKVWFVAFALIISFISASASLYMFITNGILAGIMAFILIAIGLMILLLIGISPIMLILSLKCLVKSINRYNTNDININDIVKSIILLIASFIGVCVILRGIII